MKRRKERMQAMTEKSHPQNGANPREPQSSVTMILELSRQREKAVIKGRQDTACGTVDENKTNFF